VGSGEAQRHECRDRTAPEQNCIIRLNYGQFEILCRAARKETELRRPRRARHLPRILPESSLRAFYEAIDRAGDLKHQIMLRLLFYTAVRISELVSIRVADVVQKRPRRIPAVTL
jgi:integrase